ncbi:TonB-dependent receptor plug domain-containing protein [Riemerella columbina]|uniref:TonB-dependent receptor plug domain-containing protein n=1 Tax=Riemerella columbina TaxID=103810 RepID=UPI0003A2A369|nr:TonB-dependent receptor [Riemerella columbina]
MMCKRKLLLCILVCFYSVVYSQDFSLDIQLKSSRGVEYSGYAQIQLTNTNNKTPFIYTTSNKGQLKLEHLPQGIYQIKTTQPNYKDYTKVFRHYNHQSKVFYLTPLVTDIEQVVITAKESPSLASTSVIDKRAIQHLQPSSFTDILELLPGGRAKDPVFNATNQIRLREVGTSNENYDTSSLGTLFVVDGIRKNVNANMQYITGHEMLIGNNPKGYAAKRRNTINKGVDMRAISTDQIERVEIVRGVPSVEYGDLTSGLVKIIRKKGHTKYEARFKADGFSKLFALGKGFGFDKGWKMNVGIDYLDAKSDPRNDFENYKRLTASIRTEKEWQFNQSNLVWNAMLDYGQSIDDERVDPDNDFQSIDHYKSSTKSIILSNRLEWNFSQSKFLKKINFDQSVSQGYDKIEQTRFVQVSRPTAVPNTMKEGVSDGVFLKPNYTSYLEVDGKPLDIYTKLTADFDWGFDAIKNDLKVGSEWSYSKNNGEGQVFNPLEPPSPDIDTRQRTYRSIPAYQTLAYFVENRSEIPVGNHRFSFSSGTRATSLVGLDARYQMSGKYYLDPRFNFKWMLPAVTIGHKKLIASIVYGHGLQTKFPVLNSLHPEPLYIDFVQLNYFHDNPLYRRINLRTHIINPTNYDLQPAINRKNEVRMDLSYGKNQLSVTYFDENMDTGFRSTSLYRVMDYKKYDTSGIDHNHITSPPDINTLPYKNMSVLSTYGVTSNGSETWKRGIEFQLMTKRFKSINTRFTVNGSWFNTIYRNSIALYRRPKKTIYDARGQEFYTLGLYENAEGYRAEQLNTNFILDTYLPSLDLEISASLQFLWWKVNQNLRLNGTPIAYINPDGQRYPYLEKDKSDYLLQWLNYEYNDILFRKKEIPMSMHTNIKVSKIIYKNYHVAMFVNRLFSYYKPYEVDGKSINRRGLVDPYFGIEMNFNF